jgi:hypothetical protein
VAGFEGESDSRSMSSVGFGLFCLLGFTLAVPLLAWLDRVRRPKD